MNSFVGFHKDSHIVYEIKCINWDKLKRLSVAAPG